MSKKRCDSRLGAELRAAARRPELLKPIWPYGGIGIGGILLIVLILYLLLGNPSDLQPTA